MPFHRDFPPPDPVKLFVAVLWRDPGDFTPLLPRLTAQWGAVDHAGAPVPFDRTDYYTPEMGAPLFRQIFSFERLFSPEVLVAAKHLTTRLEWESTVGGNRRVNLDPGFLDYHKVVLASMKYGGKKIYLGEGVYADLVLHYVGGEWASLPWTFPDFRSGVHDETLLEMRRRYKLARRQRPGG
ncbi:MAG: DUF4416 family protein [Deltaproteobacteria bacterium]|nr:MAG: DUF4416 family protein [Deltaproteobacteria bacterium]